MLWHVRKQLMVLGSVHRERDSWQYKYGSSGHLTLHTVAVIIALM
jgi:hypothetical protein